MFHPLSNMHGLITFDEDHLDKRDMLTKYFVKQIEKSLRELNLAWKFVRCESPTLIDTSTINNEYNEEDYFTLGGWLACRPETTKGSYIYAEYLLEHHKEKLPLCVWQIGKSYRQEQTSQSYAHLKFLEFSQLEFQCIYKADSKADYYGLMLPSLDAMFKKIFNDRTEIIVSDRTPLYSLITMDIQIPYKEHNIELCSISRRNDFKDDCVVLEIAIGMDRVAHIGLNYEGDK